MSKSSRKNVTENEDYNHNDFDSDNLHLEFSKINNKEDLKYWSLYVENVNKFKRTMCKNDIIKEKLGVGISMIDQIKKRHKLKSPYRMGSKRTKNKKDENESTVNDDNEHKKNIKNKHKKNKKKSKNQDTMNISAGSPENSRLDHLSNLDLPEKSIDEKIEEIQKLLSELMKEKNEKEEKTGNKGISNESRDFLENKLKMTPEQIRRQEKINNRLQKANEELLEEETNKLLNSKY